MGEGDLGDHSYFHMHHRQVEHGFRMATGPMLEFDKIVSGIESILAPAQRKRRFQKLFDAGKFTELLADLTVDGIIKMCDEMKSSGRWKHFAHKDAYTQFEKDYV